MNSGPSWLGTLWVLFILPCFIQAAELELHPRKEIPADSPFIRLSSLVTDSRKAELYHGVFLGKFPDEGQRTIPLNYIQKRLDLKGFRFTKAVIRGGGERVIISALKGESSPSKLFASPTSRTIEPTPDKSGAYSYLTLKRNLERGTLLTPEMFKLSSNKRFIEDAFTQNEDVIGFRLERTLSEGSVLNRRHVSIPPTIEKNAVVKIIIKAPGIEISGIARSQEEGKVGDTITVRRQREDLTGTIIDPHTVLIQ
jgi:flagella basal body P-ring formation protein FlgA